MRKGALWLAAFLITGAFAFWQRVSGPTWPVAGEVTLASGQVVRYRLPRSAEVGADLRVWIEVEGGPVSGFVRCRRTPSGEDWQLLATAREGNRLVAFLPQQPAAGKLAYQFVLVPEGSGQQVRVPAKPVVVRFKGKVPLWLLLPHVLAMYLGMLLATRVGLGVLTREAIGPMLPRATLAFLVLGGLVLGPLVQKAAFGAYWTGFPLGRDLTDSKTAMAVAVWAWAAFRRDHSKTWPLLVASLVTLLVFSLPHSLLGSEIDWRKTGP